MNSNGTHEQVFADRKVRLIRAIWMIVSGLLLILVPDGIGGDAPSVKIVWWGSTFQQQHTNGVVIDGNELVRDVVAVSASGDAAFALKKDGSVVQFLGPISYKKGLPTILSNATSITAFGNGCLAIRSNGTIAGWNTPPVSEWMNRVRAGGSNFTTIIKAKSREGHPEEFTLLRNGEILGNAITISAQHDANIVRTNTPPGLNDIIAIAVGETHNLALKRDGTVVAWGDNSAGQTNVPDGLSNIVAIAAGRNFSLAVSTGELPESVLVPPHGPLEKMAAKADLVFKGQVLSSEWARNQHVQDFHANLSSDYFMPFVQTTKLKLTSVLKGSIATNVIFLHHLTRNADPEKEAYQGRRISGMVAPGFTPVDMPSYDLDVGKSYLVFAERATKPGRECYSIYNPTNAANAFRPMGKPYPWFSNIEPADAITGTLDNSPLDGLSVRDAFRVELIRLLQDSNPSNQLFAIHHFQKMTMDCDETWENSHDFRREDVLSDMKPLLTHTNDDVSIAAIACFQVRPDCAWQLEPYVDDLVLVASQASSPSCRAAAIDVFVGTKLSRITNALPLWLNDRAEPVRVHAAQLLLDFPGDLAEKASRQLAGDESPKVRSIAAAVIGEGLYERNAAMLGRLFDDTDATVHTNAAASLLKFKPAVVKSILEARLDDREFYIKFIAKLAEEDAGPWLPQLTGILEEHCLSVTNGAKTGTARHKMTEPNQAVADSACNSCWWDLLNYLFTQPSDAFLSGKMRPYTDLLEKTLPTITSPSHDEIHRMYELYAMRNMWVSSRRIRHDYTSDKGRFDVIDRFHSR